jgi:uncharacterized membrane protein
MSINPSPGNLPPTTPVPEPVPAHRLAPDGDKHLIYQKTFWTTLVGVISSIGTAFTGFAAIEAVDLHTKARLALGAGICLVLTTLAANLGNVFSRQGAIETSKRMIARSVRHSGGRS